MGRWTIEPSVAAVMSRRLVLPGTPRLAALRASRRRSREAHTGVVGVRLLLLSQRGHATAQPQPRDELLDSRVVIVLRASARWRNEPIGAFRPPTRGASPALRKGWEEAGAAVRLPVGVVRYRLHVVEPRDLCPARGGRLGDGGGNGRAILDADQG